MTTSRSNKVNSQPAYVIRLEYAEHRIWCWRVSIRRRGMRFAKNFSDTTWGGKDKALVAAQQYRDSILASIPPLSQREYGQIRRKNNTSGTVGAHMQKKRGGDAWCAALQLKTGKIIRAVFAVNDYGNERAKALAIAAREQMLLNVDSKKSFVPWHDKEYQKLDPALAESSRINKPRMLTVRIARYRRSEDRIALCIRVSDSQQVCTKSLDVLHHGEHRAHLLAIQATRSWVEALGGVDACQQFDRHPACKLKQMPEQGLQFRVHLLNQPGVSAPMRQNAPKQLRCSFVRYHARRVRRGKLSIINQLKVSISDGHHDLSRTFSLNFYGEDIAFDLAKKFAIRNVKLIVGPMTTRLFKRSILADLSHLPPAGINARIPIFD